MLNTTVHGVIINPNAGRRKGNEISAVLERELALNKIPCDFFFTEKAWDAATIAEECCKRGISRFIVAGGDGTLNETVNGYFRQKCIPVHEIVTANVPVGTGNDWGRTLKLPASPSEIVRLITENKTFTQDAGKVSWAHNGLQEERYFVNVSGLGFDAMVTDRVNRQKLNNKTGKLPYLMSLLSSLIHYKPEEAIITADGREIFRGNLFSMCAGIGKYNGGGMMQLPGADPCDGLLDLTIIRKISKLEVILNVGRLYNGNIGRNKKVSMFRVKESEIRSTAPLMLETDGEFCGYTPLKYSILPAALRFYGCCPTTIQ